MTPDAAFLQAIIASPDDDALRLAYADYLDERGDPRGEFIRIQIDLARLPEGDKRREVLEARERQVLMEHEDEFIGPFRSPLLHWRFRRGFVTGFAHAGLFQRTEVIVDYVGYRCWSYLRFYGDGFVIFVTSDGSPSQVARWFRRGDSSLGRQPPPAGRYALQQTSRRMELSFSLTAGYGAGFGLLVFAGRVEVRSDLFGVGLDVRLVLDMHIHNEGQTVQQVFQLVDVPGFDSASE